MRHAQPTRIYSAGHTWLSLVLVILRIGVGIGVRATSTEASLQAALQIRARSISVSGAARRMWGDVTNLARQSLATSGFTGVASGAGPTDGGRLGCLRRRRRSGRVRRRRSGERRRTLAGAIGGRGGGRAGDRLLLLLLEVDGELLVVLLELLSVDRRRGPVLGRRRGL